MKMDCNSFYSSLRLLLILLVTLFLFTSFQKSFTYDDSFHSLTKLRLAVLKENSVGKVFEFDLTKQDGCNKTKLTYLGIVTTNNHKKYKLLNSFWVTGTSCRGISRLVIYDTNNIYVGNYKMDMPYQLPDELVNNEIAYKTDHDDCKNRKGTNISFKSGLPKSFLVCEVPYYFQGDE